MKFIRLFLLFILFSSVVSCSHWSLVEEAKDTDKNIWIKRGNWLDNTLYYCVVPTAKDAPKCIEAEFYK